MELNQVQTGEAFTIEGKPHIVYVVVNNPNHRLLIQYERVDGAGDITEKGWEQKGYKVQVSIVSPLGPFAIGKRVERLDGGYTQGRKGKIVNIDADGQRLRVKWDSSPMTWVSIKSLKPL